MTERLRIKICGVRTPEIARVAADAGADALGLVFADASPRRLTVQEAAQVAEATPPFVDLVGLFVKHDTEAIRETAAEVPLTLLQLHGDYDVEAIDALHPMRVLRAVHFKPDRAESLLRQWEGHYRELSNLAGLLIDTPDPAKAGGTGRTFDWTALRKLLEEVRPKVPIILAGGLTAENVGEAVRTVRPWAVDVSSGVEVERGVKDADRVRRFCVAAGNPSHRSPSSIT